MSNRRAPEGQVYVCAACGKVSHWAHGISKSGKSDASPGWDESCMLNAMLVDEKDIRDPADWVYPQRVKRVSDEPRD